MEDHENSHQSRPGGFASSFNEVNSALDRIEERIRNIETVAGLTRQLRSKREWRNNIERAHLSPETRAEVGENPTMPSLDRTSERRRSGCDCERDNSSSHLVANDKEGGGVLYHCSICLESAKQPVLTCCGHLFCWACFHQVPKVDAISKECPLCKGRVSDDTVIPIYGSGRDESGLGSKKIPPRPKGKRFESGVVPVMQWQSPVRRTRTSIQRHEEGVILNEEETTVADHHRISRVMHQSAVWLSLLADALDGAAWIVEGVETVINYFSPSEAPSDGVNDPNPNSNDRRREVDYFADAW